MSWQHHHGGGDSLTAQGLILVGGAVLFSHFLFPLLWWMTGGYEASQQQLAPTVYINYTPAAAGDNRVPTLGTPRSGSIQQLALPAETPTLTPTMDKTVAYPSTPTGAPTSTPTGAPTSTPTGAPTSTPTRIPFSTTPQAQQQLPCLGCPHPMPRVPAHYSRAPLSRIGGEKTCTP